VYLAPKFRWRMDTRCGSRISDLKFVDFSREGREVDFRIFKGGKQKTGSKTLNSRSEGRRRTWIRVSMDTLTYTTSWQEMFYLINGMRIDLLSRWVFVFCFFFFLIFNAIVYAKLGIWLLICLNISKGNNWSGKRHW